MTRHGELFALLVRLIEQSRRPSLPRRILAAGSVPNLTISWGYAWQDGNIYGIPAGTHDMESCSPPSNLTANQQAQIIETTYNNSLAAGGSPARWVDGYPPNIVQSVATYLGVPVGQPSDWFDTTG